MTICECQIHKCQFGIEAPEGADQAMREKCFIQCPLCEREEKSRMRDELSKLREQIRCLLTAVEIKQEYLQKVISK
jgi:hypothetical protein